MWIFFVLPVIGLLVMLISHASHSLDDLKLHWNEYRCHPGYMPFAESVRPDVTVSENMYYCMGLFGNELFKPFMDVLNSLFADVHSSIGEITGPLALFRQLFTRIRKFMLGFMSTTFSKITNSTSVISYQIIKIRDVMKRFVAQGYISAFIGNALIDSAMSFVTLFMSVVKTFVYGLLATSIFLALFQPELLAIAILISTLIAASGF